jgi:thymidylate synthase (FAD)
MRIIDASFKIIEPELQKLSPLQRIERCGRICYRSEDRITEESADPFVMGCFNNSHFSVLEMLRLHFKIKHMDINLVLSLLQFKYLDIDMSAGCVYISGSLRGFYEVINSFDGTFMHPYLVAINDLLFAKFPKIFKREIPSHLIRSGHGKVTKSGEEIFGNDIPYSHRYIAVHIITNRAVTHEIVRHRPVTYLQESQRYCNYGAGKFNQEVTFINPKPFFADDAIGIDYHYWKQACEYSEKMYLKLLKNGKSSQAARTVLPNSCKTEIIVYTNTTEWKWMFKLRTSPAAEPSMREIMIPLEQEMYDGGYLVK